MVRPDGSVSEPPVLVAGATGWLGSSVVRALVRGLPDVPALARPWPARVRALARPDEFLDALGDLRADVDVVRGDLLDPPSLDGFLRDAAGATLFVAAGLVHPRLRVRDLFRVNVVGTRALLERAERAGVRRAVVVSSNSPVGVGAFDGEVFDEDSPCRPYLAYGRSKAGMEQVCREVAARGRLEVVVARAPWFYGPNQPERQLRFFRMIREGRAPLPGAGANLRSLAYVDNLAQGLLRCARTPAAASQVYWLADARPYPFAEILDTVEDLLERDFGLPCARRRLRLPRLVPRLARAADRALQAGGLYNQEVHVLGELDRTIACSIERARRELGYEPAIALREGMRRSIACALARGASL
jgi:nucleoside-diphosphate-sugar epimerase